MPKHERPCSSTNTSTEVVLMLMHTSQCVAVCSNCLQTDILEVAYTACLLEEQGSWGAAPSSNTQQLALRTSNTSYKIRSSSGSVNGSSSGSSNSRLSKEALTLMAERLAQQVLQPQDPAAAATAQLQVKGNWPSSLGCSTCLCPKAITSSLCS